MEEGDTSKYSMDEKVRMYEILKDNSNIIALLSKVHQEVSRREVELKKRRRTRKFNTIRKRRKKNKRT